MPLPRAIIYFNLFKKRSLQKEGPAYLSNSKMNEVVRLRMRKAQRSFAIQYLNIKGSPNVIFWGVRSSFLYFPRSSRVFTTTTILFFVLNASTLNNTDTVRPGGGKKTLWSSRLPPPNHLLSKTLNERAQQPWATQQKRKQRLEHCFNLTQYLYNPNDEQDQEIMDTIHMQDKFQVNVVL